MTIKLPIFIKNLSKKIYRYGFKNEFVELMKLSLPLVLTNYTSFMIPFISILFCGHIGNDELDAASLANNLIDLCGFSIVYGLSSACDTLFPQYYGSLNKKSVGIVLQKGVIITVLGSLISIALLFNTKNFMIYLNPNENVVELADTYILYYLPSFLFSAVGNVLVKYLQSQNVAYPVLIMTFIINIVNAALHAFFIFGLDMNIRGAAIACTISNALQPMLTFVYIYYSKIYYATWPGWSIKCFEGWWTYYKLAIPAFLMILLEWVCFECGTFFSSFIGLVELGAQTIAQQMLIFCYMLPLGVGTAGCIRIGQYLGSKRADEAKNACKVTLTICGFFIFVVISIISGFHNLLPKAFTNDPNIDALASKLLLIIAATHLIDGTQTSLASVLRSIGAQFFGTLTYVVGLYMIALPIGLSLMLETSLKLYGFWIGIIIGGSCLIIMQLIYIFKIDWKKESEIAAKGAEMEQSVENIELEDEIQNRMSDINLRNNSSDSLIETYSTKEKTIIFFKKFVFILFNLLICAALAQARYIIPTAKFTTLSTNHSTANNTTLIVF